MSENAEARNLVLTARAARLYVNALVDTNSKRYFNTTIGAMVRSCGSYFDCVHHDIKLEEDDFNTDFVNSRYDSLKAEIDRASKGGLFDPERQLLDLMDAVNEAYREYAAKRADLTSEAASGPRL